MTEYENVHIYSRKDFTINGLDDDDKISKGQYIFNAMEVGGDYEAFNSLEDIAKEMIVFSNQNIDQEPYEECFDFELGEAPVAIYPGDGNEPVLKINKCLTDQEKNELQDMLISLFESGKAKQIYEKEINSIKQGTSSGADNVKIKSK
ncbi:MAG: hypothetical protein KJ906_02990 [Nanoarchaeota archaeon]|nr:hypothetical protein [Nanoarchaeota archaeon]